MLRLKNITKDYKVADNVVHALQGVTLNFRKNEFVSVLGQSGCGKTTLLNIIGGLDHYTSGDLEICGKSTKAYKDRDWDVYRNHRIGFVFQSYNLIPHQTVLGNVELALTIAGVSKTERRERAKLALEKVGLGNELHKRPNQLSGGQMQRVAIARALVNNPEILLADEPTGALDTATSLQIMELIREIAGERLVIMVTHNPEIAEQYSTRIVKLQDGLVVGDSNPYEPTEAYVAEEVVENVESAESAEEPQTGTKKKKSKKERAAMSFRTALGLSARNLLTKKGRTAVTSIAGSIGIISVCLVLALSNGFNNYIHQTQEDMLSSNPLQIKETTVDVSAIMSGMSSANDLPDLSQIGDNVYVNSFLTNMAQGMTVKNNLSDEYLAYVAAMDAEWYEAIQYDTGMRLENSLYTQIKVLDEGGQEKAEAEVMSLSEIKAYYTLKLTQQEAKYADLVYLVDYLGDIYGKMPGTTDTTSASFGEYVLSQYDVVEGSFPQSANEAVLVIGDNNDITDLTLAQLGLLDETEFLSLFPQEGASEKIEMKIPFEEITAQKFSLFYNDTIYSAYEQPNAKEYIYEYVKQNSLDTEDGTKGIDIQITGILRLKDGLNYGCLGDGGLFFTEALYDQLLSVNKDSAIAKTLTTQSLTVEQFSLLSSQLSQLEKGSDEYVRIANEMSRLMVQAAMDQSFKPAAANIAEYYMSAESIFTAEDGTLDPAYEGIYFIYGDSAIRHVGGKTAVNCVSIYTSTFDAKDQITSYLDAWNDDPNTATEDQVKYTDTIGMMMGMVEMMLNAITYVLVAFTAISLVVSSVMIGIITYVSVVERTKEIGVLRSLGARKKDIRNLFNAETFIIGLTSGLFGVGVTYLLSLAINAILGSLTGIATLAALPILSAFVMICVSVGLTLISGLIPARAAAKKDPVIALRTE